MGEEYEGEVGRESGKARALMGWQREGEKLGAEQ